MGDVGDNKIEEIEPFTKVNFPNLTYLYLEKNKVAAFDLIKYERAILNRVKKECQIKID